MRSAVACLTLLCAGALTIAARADVIDTFVVTTTAHTVTFNLPETYSFPDQLHFVAIGAVAGNANVDGVGGYTLQLWFGTSIGGAPALQIGGFDATGISLYGAGQGVMWNWDPQTGTPGHYIDSITFVPGSYGLSESHGFVAPPSAATVTITRADPPAVTTPEPSGLVLMGTGGAALMALLRRKVRGGL